MNRMCACESYLVHHFHSFRAFVAVWTGVSNHEVLVDTKNGFFLVPQLRWSVHQFQAREQVNVVSSVCIKDSGWTELFMFENHFRINVQTGWNTYGNEVSKSYSFEKLKTDISGISV